MFVLDTTAVSAFMRLDEEFLSFIRQFRPADITTVQPVVAEIEYGIHRLAPDSRKSELLQSQLNRIRATIQILPWDNSASENYGKMKAELEHRGEMIEDFDIAIAAIAKSHAQEVITANLVHFRRITSVKARHWTDCL